MVGVSLSSVSVGLTPSKRTFPIPLGLFESSDALLSSETSSSKMSSSSMFFGSAGVGVTTGESSVSYLGISLLLVGLGFSVAFFFLSAVFLFLVVGLLVSLVSFSFSLLVIRLCCALILDTACVAAWRIGCVRLVGMVLVTA